MPRAELNDEHYRIMRAAANDRLVTSDGGRWQIVGEMRPDRKCRERLKARGLIDFGIDAQTGRFSYRKLALTDKGREALADRPMP